MKYPVDYSKTLRRKLAEGKTFDDALGELRALGASMFDCIASVKSFHKCELIEAKRLVEGLPVWSDHGPIKPNSDATDSLSPA
jgi:hypothetical protein